VAILRKFSSPCFVLTKFFFNVFNLLNIFFIEFMGIWSEPCIKTEYAISDLASEFSGQFIFAKIDIDEQEELKQQFSITNVPTLIVFKDGKEVQREEGELQAQEFGNLSNKLCACSISPMSKKICAMSKATRTLLGSDEIA
jgi:thioredoxin-like negative regulator of GroEL